MLGWLYDHVRENKASIAAVAGTTGFAGVAESGALDTLPRSWLVPVVGFAMTTLLSFVVYLAKRDYTRIDETGKETKRDVQAVATNFAIFRTDMTNSMANLQAGLTNAMASLRTEITGELSSCVKHPHLGDSLNRIHEKIATVSHNLTIVEAELGLHKRKRMANEPIGPDDETPPMGTRRR